MLFNSHAFLLVFLPLALALFYGLQRKSMRLAALSLTVLSVGFYAWWEVDNLGPLFLSMAVNYLVGISLVHFRERASPTALRGLLTAGIVFDLGMLGWYKYSGFLAGIAAQFSGSLPFSETVLPLGVSFFTFTQIAFLVDAYRGEAKEYSPITYILFVTFFPHLIAGPIIHHKEMMPQFADRATYRLRPDNIALGLAIATIGLCKKVFLADNLAPFADGVFANAAEAPLTLLDSWMGALAYTFQLYFDFSGYSDMAVGFALMFNIALPWNFDSPYRAGSIIEFWRRWHMTLSRFLRDYLYFPLGGNRKGPARTYLNVFIVMVLGGLWHGAGWTFIAWGALHGVLILANHAWRDLFGTRPAGRVARQAGWAATFVAVTVAWVFFRAPDMATALAIVEGMAGLNGVALGENHRLVLGPAADLLAGMGVRFATTTEFSLLSLPWLAAAAAICFLLPNTRQWAMAAREAGRLPRILHFRPGAAWGLACGAAALAALAVIGGPSQFLYFNF